MGSSDAIRRRLEERLAQLDRRTTQIQADLRKPGDPDWQERATEAENQEVLERLDEAELAEMQEIRRALARIAEGSYGDCARCGEAIDPRRLEALPVTSLCIGCAD